MLGSMIAIRIPSNSELSPSAMVARERVHERRRPSEPGGDVNDYGIRDPISGIHP